MIRSSHRLGWFSSVVGGPVLVRRDAADCGVHPPGVYQPTYSTMAGLTSGQAPPPSMRPDQAVHRERREASR
jgi:hypothetical protein